MTELQSKHAGPAPKYDRVKFLKKYPRITDSLREKILKEYEKGHNKGIKREEVLADLADKYERSARTIERYIKKS